MFLQGQLQKFFDALYSMGLIDPVLELDWQKEMEALPEHAEVLQEVITVANLHQDDPQRLVNELHRFPKKALHFFAMEVAREYAEYHSRESLH